MATWVFEVTEFKSVVRCDLGVIWRLLEALVVRSNIHMGTRVTEVADFNSEVNFDLRGH